MMKLYTQVAMPQHLPAISHADRLLVMGSCFAEEMGNRFREAKFRCLVNPFGVLYNPLSISAALRQIMLGKVYVEADLFHYNGCWHSSMHHGSFSSADEMQTLEHINSSLQAAHHFLPDATLLVLTLGTAWVYERKDDGVVVGNCHKQPEACFSRRRLSTGEIVTEYRELLIQLFATNPGLRVVFTVSPIRHIRDGLHENQLSKATLLLIVDDLQQAFPDKVYYFPSYELLLDELRDYRFYADDLVHPSAMAAELIWERLGDACFSIETKKLIKEVEGVKNMLNHRPSHPDTEEYRLFLQQIMLKIETLRGKTIYFDFQNELEICRTRLNALQK